MGLTHSSVGKVQAPELLSGQVQQLLLELLLALGEIELSGKQLSSNVGIDLALLELKRGRR